MNNVKDFMTNITSKAAAGSGFMTNITSKATAGTGVNLKAIKKELEEIKSKKLKMYGYIGMETYDLMKDNKIELPQLNGYIEKMEELNQIIAEKEEFIKKEEAKNKGENICACGYKLTPQDRFCPNCGEEIPRDTVICSCGAEIQRGAKFCHSCGKSMEDILSQQEPQQQPVKECICGARLAPGQFMCLECGRKVE